MVDVPVVQLHRCCSWRDGMCFLGRVHRYTARGCPCHQGGEGVDDDLHDFKQGDGANADLCVPRQKEVHEMDFFDEDV